MCDLLGVQLEYHVSHVGQELNNGLHYHSLGVWVAEVRLVLDRRAAAVREAFTYLVDPELQSKVEAPEGLFLENTHSCLSGFACSNVLGAHMAIGVALAV